MGEKHKMALVVVAVVAVAQGWEIRTAATCACHPHAPSCAHAGCWRWLSRGMLWSGTPLRQREACRPAAARRAATPAAMVPSPSATALTDAPGLCLRWIVFGGLSTSRSCKGALRRARARQCVLPGARGKGCSQCPGHSLTPLDKAVVTVWPWYPAWQNAYSALSTPYQHPSCQDWCCLHECSE